jgi:hypothetical protein
LLDSSRGVKRNGTFRFSSHPSVAQVGELLNAVVAHRSIPHVGCS